MVSDPDLLATRAVSTTAPGKTCQRIELAPADNVITGLPMGSNDALVPRLPLDAARSAFGWIQFDTSGGRTPKVCRETRVRPLHFSLMSDLCPRLSTRVCKPRLLRAGRCPFRRCNPAA